MSPETPPVAPPVSPVTSLNDPRALQILSTEHWSLLSSRSRAYNEAFTRAGMFLSFLSMSFVALALLAQGMSFGEGGGAVWISVAGAVVVFGVLALLTTGRIARQQAQLPVLFPSTEEPPLGGTDQ